MSKDRTRKQSTTPGSTYERLQILFKSRNYRIFALGDLASLIGNWIQRVATGWLAWELTHSAAWLGIVAFAELAPALIMAPLGGAIADRGDPRMICLSTQIARMFQALALCILTLTGNITIWLLVILGILRGALSALNQPARQSLIPRLVSREELPSAIAINALNFNTGRFIGPPIAGLAIALSGPGFAFALNVLSFFAFIYALWVIDVPKIDRPVRQRGKHALASEIVEGLRFVWTDPGVRLLMGVLCVVSLLVRPVTDMLPGFAARVFEQDAMGLAWMTSANGIGAMLGGYAVIRLESSQKLTGMLISNLVILAAATILFSITQSFFFGLILLAVLGYSFTVNGICTQSLLHASIDDSIRGRIMSLYGVILRSVPAAGALVIGILAEIFGLGPPFLVAGLLMAILAAMAVLHRDKFIDPYAEGEKK
ncbi:MAG: hypothetical protein RLZ98_830 [Pseudomonadota bacterium]